MTNYQLVPAISSKDIETTVEELARRINSDYEGKSLILVGILKGAFIFLSDLARRLTVPVRVDFVRLASYGLDTETSGKITITKDIDLTVRDQHVLVVEDIVDTGTTLAWYMNHLKGSGAASVRICALIDKKERRQIEIPLDYVGISVEKGFLVGYGLDYSENHRNLPAIYEVRFNE
ncbi:MAG: hypoxanthine phosphoribosyltransferase [Syntrophobacteraceae bacterium]|jgi:hypoxanthine phosphoribosyltransferase|nr:hypoxanthine phosphoribosyltransferase [Syntrophobacteraceae bacterium]